MNQLSENYFYTFKMNILSGRQTPATLGKLLRVIIFCEIIPVVFVVFAGQDAITSAFIRKAINITITIIFILTLVFSFKKIYVKSQKAQYFIFFINIIEFAALFILLGVIGLFNETADTDSINPLRNLFSSISSLIGILVFFGSILFFRKLVLLGRYQENSLGTEKMKKNEKIGKKIWAYIIPLSIITPMIVKNLIPDTTGTNFFMGVLFIILGWITYIGAAWTSMTLYCKLRFKSFNPPVEQITKETENYK